MKLKKKKKNKDRSKLWNKLFQQAIPFFILVYMAGSFVWITAEYVLAWYGKTPVGELTVQIAIGIPIALVTFAFSTGFDHWLQDHYKVDNDGRPRSEKEDVVNEEAEVENDPEE